MTDLGIRRENKGRWERRAPLAPHHVEELVREHGRSFVVQPSPLRVFADDEYRAAGATVREDLDGCRVILGVKEIPPPLIVPEAVHMAFFHVTKGQRENLGQLRRALDARATLIDYEPIVDPHGRRLVFFGRHAGYAGMIDALWTLGRRLRAEGIDTPFGEVRQTKDYAHLEEALRHLADTVGRSIREHGLPEPLQPLVVGITGGGNVARGALEVLDRLPVVEVAPDELPELFAPDAHPERSARTLYKVIFRRGDRVDFARHLPYLTLLVNGVYWNPATDPRLVTWSDLARLWGDATPPRLRVIADLSCDVGGSIEATVEQTLPENPVFVADPATRRTAYGVEGRGPVILAVGNLPAELPRDATEHFGDSLFPYLDLVAAADFDVPLGALALPPELLRAVIVHRGELTPGYRHLADLLEDRAPEDRPLEDAAPRQEVPA